MSPLSRPLTGENLTFSMAQHITQLRQDDSYMRSGRAGRTLVKAGMLRLTLTVLADGVEVGTHHAEAPMTVHVLEGGLRYRVEGADFELGRGQVLFFGPGHAQDIRALGDTSLLLTITREDGNGAEGSDEAALL
jgi:quercetin dioxygenase-like cupin family protein